MTNQNLIARCLVLLSLFVVTTAGSAEKAKGPYAKLLDQVCRADIAKHCKGSKLGVTRADRLWNCAQEKRDQFTPSCQAELTNLEKTFSDIKAKCQSDLDRFCGSVAPGAGAWVKCLKARQKDLNHFCREGLYKTF